METMTYAQAQAEIKRFDMNCTLFPTVVNAILNGVGRPRINKGAGYVWADFGIDNEQQQVLLLARQSALNPRVPADLALLLRMCPNLLFASLEMIRVYLGVTQQSRGQQQRKVAA